MTTHDHDAGHRHQPAQDEHKKHHQPRTAAGEVVHAVEEAETTTVDDGERRGKDREAADALTPNENAQDDVQRRES